MTIAIGDKIPAHDFIVMGADGPDKQSTSSLFDGKKVVLIGVPGAFTPTCHSTHLPGFLRNLDALKDKGVDSVAVTTVNDVHVVNAWAKATEGNGKIEYLADGNGDFAKAIGMDADLAIAGMGVRSKRYAMVVDNGTVTHLNIEEMPGKAELSSAEAILEQL